MTDEQRAKIAAATRARWVRGEPNPMTGRKHREETRQRMAERARAREARRREGKHVESGA